MKKSNESGFSLILILFFAGILMLILTSTMTTIIAFGKDNKIAKKMLKEQEKIYNNKITPFKKN